MAEDAAGLQSVLRCGQCNKPFDKQSTLKRHAYYCRSRKSSTATRPRACIPCARGKTGCDHRRPQCTRCTAKSITCQYPPDKSRPAVTGDPRSVEASIQTVARVPGSPTVDIGQEANNGGDMIVNGALGALVPSFTNLGDDYRCPWEWDDSNIACVDLLGTDAYYPPPDSPPSAPRSTPSSNQTTWEHRRYSTHHQLTIPRVPTSTVRSLVRRPRLEAGSQRVRSLILHTLNSYPLMIIRHGTLPPFIHSSSISPNAENPHMEPLTNCMTLAHMLTSGVQGSRKMFWKNVALECEHLLHEHRTLHRWELLAAMQALSIYLFIRMDEGETDHNNLDVLLVSTFIGIAQQLGQTDIACHAQGTCGCNSRLELSWKEWIFRESRRRLNVVYRVVNMLIYFDPATLCDMPNELLLAPLPARKQLWQARDESSWLAESHRQPGMHDFFALAADGDIVKLDESRLSCTNAWLSDQSTDVNAAPKSGTSFGEWCSGMDELGALVTLAASLIE